MVPYIAMFMILLLFFFFSYSANLILDPRWETISRKIKFDLSSVINKILEILYSMKGHLESINYCRLLLSIIKNPWDHHYLPKLLYGSPCEEEGKIKIFKIQ